MGVLRCVCSMLGCNPSLLDSILPVARAFQGPVTLVPGTGRDADGHDTGAGEWCVSDGECDAVVAVDESTPLVR